jgi:hypothetical protein
MRRLHSTSRRRRNTFLRVSCGGSRVVRPPAIGATLLAVDTASVSHVPGIIKVVRQKDFLAVVAQTEWGAISGARRSGQTIVRHL